VVCVLLAVSASAQDRKVKIIALNDFHGNLESPGRYRADAQSPEVPVGGADYLAGYIAWLRHESAQSIVVSAGDLTGASPLVSALFHDEPTIEVMNRMGLALNAVGNHELDKGRAELMRKQRGGCSTADKNTCKGADDATAGAFTGAKFEYLAANVRDRATGKTIFPEYAIENLGGVKIAFLGLTLKETPTMVTPAGVAGLEFEDEADTINRIVRHLDDGSIAGFVVLIHQGGLLPQGVIDINGCEGGLANDPIPKIVSRLDDRVDLVLSAHTHVAYICHLPNSKGRAIPVTSAGAFGRVLTDVDLTVSAKSGRVADIEAHNILVDRTNADVVPDGAIAAIVARYKALTAPITNRTVGTIAADIAKESKVPSGETEMGDLIADAQLAATREPRSGGAVIAFMNLGGVRTGLNYAGSTPDGKPGDVTFGELYTAQPFGNQLVTMTLTGAEIKEALEEQFIGCAPAGSTDVPNTKRLLGVSEGFTYTWDPNAAPCHRIAADSVRLDGAPLKDAANYRVTMNELVAGGGEQLPAFKKGTDRVFGEADLDAMVAYFGAHSPVKPPKVGRIHEVQ
jgi:5'-nucleotidase